MSVFASVGILFLSMLIMAFLMLTPGVFANFFHHASGKYSRKKTDTFSLFFIFGAETLTALIFLFVSTIIWALPLSVINSNSGIISWIFVGIFIALSLATFLFYFHRNSSGSQLFIPRPIAQKLLNEPKYIKKRSDAFVLGFVSGIPELPFTLPLYFYSTLTMIKISIAPTSFSALIILFAIITVCPLFILHTSFRTNHNLADYLRFRTNHKTFFRFFISFLYLLLAILIIVFRTFSI